MIQLLFAHEAAETAAESSGLPLGLSLQAFIVQLKHVEPVYDL